MAAPEFKVLTDLSGTWTMNKQLSSDLNSIFALQGMPWLYRKFLSLGKVTLRMSHTSEASTVVNGTPQKVYQIRQRQIVNPGGFDTEDVYLCDGVSRNMSVPIWGDISSTMEYAHVDTIQIPILRETLNASGITEVILETVRSKQKHWLSLLAWGFQEVDGMRRFTQNIVVDMKGTQLMARVVYDFSSEP